MISERFLFPPKLNLNYFDNLVEEERTVFLIEKQKSFFNDFCFSILYAYNTVFLKPFLFIDHFLPPNFMLKYFSILKNMIEVVNNFVSTEKEVKKKPLKLLQSRLLKRLQKRFRPAIAKLLSLSFVKPEADLLWKWKLGTFYRPLRFSVSFLEALLNKHNLTPVPKKKKRVRN
jgi:hypothetical protein